MIPASIRQVWGNGDPLVAAAVAAGHAGHQLLRVVPLDVGKEPPGGRAAQRGGMPPGVVDEHL